MQCPKCGEAVGDDSVICSRCDFILDPSFLGDDILNEHTSGKHRPVTSPGDAVMIGGLDEEVALFSESTGSFLTADTQDVDRAVVPAALYVGKSVQELMKPEAVLRAASDVDKRKAMLSAFELHVLSFIDGRRPVARIRKKTGLSPDDVRIAVGMLAEKGAVELAGVIEKPRMKDLVGSMSSEEDIDATAEDAKLPGLEVPAPIAAVAPIAPAAAPAKKSGEWKPAVIEVESLEDQSDVVAAPPADDEKKLARERAAGFFELAHIELKKGNRVRAHVYAKLAADTDPDEPKYRDLLKRWPQAARAATTLDASLVADADIAEKQGNHHKALALLEQALDANPDAAHVHNRIALLLATRFKRFSDASEHLMKACALEPDNVAYKNNLGKIIAVAHEKGTPVTKKDTAASGGLLGKLKKALE
jgi:hypothetical protein